MSIEKVEELILRQAREEADSLLEEAQQQAQRHLRQTEAQLRQRNQQELERYRRQLQEDSDRELAARTTEHNRELLVERNRLLGEVRRKAEARIAQRPQPQYRRWLAQQLRQLTDTKEGELLCRGDDRETIAELLEELAGQGVRLNLTLSSEELQSAGGFVVRCPEYDVDVTLESQLRALWPHLLPEVANRLFGEPGNRGG
ncbi:MAG: hypothetical protein KAX80_13005 [Planctomycetes bacterium]|nr:hypothetical protein [Planctomycetota bacterium]